MRWDALLRVYGWRVSPVLRRFPRLNAAMWNVQYKLGIWDHLSTAPDGEILRLVQEYSPHASILDLGCGSSVNLPLIPGSFRQYHGVDISESAIRQARALKRPGTSFEVADIFTYQPGEQYDAILLKEVLYFTADRVVELLHRLAGFLSTDGKIFVQVWQGAALPNATPAQFADLIRNCGLTVFEERERKTPDGSPGGFFWVLGH